MNTTKRLHQERKRVKEQNIEIRSLIIEREKLKIGLESIRVIVKFWLLDPDKKDDALSASVNATIRYATRKI